MKTISSVDYYSSLYISIKSRINAITKSLNNKSSIKRKIKWNDDLRTDQEESFRKTRKKLNVDKQLNTVTLF